MTQTPLSPEDGTPPEDDMQSLAAEYALGLTPVEETGAVLERLRREPEFATAVTMWQERLGVLAEDIRPAKPPRRAKKKLNKRLFGVERRPLLQRAGTWQLISFAALAGAVWISLNDLTVDVGPTVPSFAAQLDNADEGLTVLAVYDPSRGGIMISRTAGGARDGRVLELWAIPEGEAPVSLGVLPDSLQVWVQIPDALALQAPALTLALSDEPPGGSPTGAPTGDVLAAMAVSAL
ncbi:anti-sigma factor [uncultured Roseobacter sp.]|uniref:anti-sigma factor n=1 Tax=uncultured Roseobacter sp. TaxID=114847 RepID=UPI00261948A4|nr:anti-sigma factor [uncultured Roseobacter sp.]